MADLAKLVVKLEAESSKLRAELERTNSKLNHWGKNVDRVARRAKAAFASIAGAYVGFAGIKAATGELASFEKTLSGVRAVTRATDEQMVALKATARELGAVTQFSATQAAQGMEFLGRAGFKTTDIISAMPGLLDLAAAGALELGRAADIASNVLSGFQLQAKESNRVSDILALTAASANTNVEQLGDAMSYVAPVAAAFSKSVEETSAALGILGNAGIQASSAGTGLRGILANLATVTPQAAAALREMGLSAKDVNPQTKSLTEIVDALASAGLSAGQALTIFGDRAGPAILALTSQNAELKKLVEQMNGAEGSAKRMAATMSDNLIGDVKSLSSAMSELIQKVGDAGVTGALRTATQWATNFARAAGKIVESRDQEKFYRLADLRNLYKQKLSDRLAGGGGFFGDTAAQLREKIQVVESEMRRLQDRNADRIKRMGGGATPDGMAAGSAPDKARLEIVNNISKVEDDIINKLAKQKELFTDLLAETRAQINTPQTNPLIKGTPFEAIRALDAADSLMGKGQNEEAAKKAETAVYTIRSLVEAEKISRTYANSLLNKAERLGVGALNAGVGEAAMKIKFDEDASKREAQRIKAAVEAQFAAQPAVMPILLSPVATPTSPAGGAQQGGTPIVFDLNGQRTEVTAFGDDVPALRSVLSREIEKRGRK